MGFVPALSSLSEWCQAKVAQHFSFKIIWFILKYIMNLYKTSEYPIYIFTVKYYSIRTIKQIHLLGLLVMLVHYLTHRK